MRRIGLTGGIACGKTTVSSLLQEKNIPILDADHIARDIVRIGSPALTEIAEHFGQTYLCDDGSLNREALRRLIIHNPTAKDELEQITHPRIFAEIVNWEKEKLFQNHTACIVDAALMVETGSYHRYDQIIVVRCDPKQQIERLMQRNQITENEAKAWIASQYPLPTKEAIADIIIDNSSGFQDLNATVENTWKKYLASLP